MITTVKQMIEDLSKFPLDAECYAYEGEVIGLIISKGNKEGIIFCNDTKTKIPTEFFTD